MASGGIGPRESRWSEPRFVEQTVNRLDASVNAATPVAAFQYVDVTFPSNADTDIDIKHTLPVTDPDSVRYEVVRKDRACDVYDDQSGSRRAWTTTAIYLRCDTASAVCRLRLSLERT